MIDLIWLLALFAVTFISSCGLFQLLRIFRRLRIRYGFAITLIWALVVGVAITAPIAIFKEIEEHTRSYFTSRDLTAQIGVFGYLIIFATSLIIQYNRSELKTKKA